MSRKEEQKQPTLAALQKLVDAAHSTTPPDPTTPSDEVSSLIDAACNFYPLTEMVRTIASLFLSPVFEFEWEPDRADDLEDFLYEQYDGDEEEIKARIEALKKGAEPTEDELDDLESNFPVYSLNPTYYLLKVTAPVIAPQKALCAYFVSARAETGQYSDQVGAYGPFLFLEAVVQWLRQIRYFNEVNLTPFDDKEEARLLQEAISALGVTV